MSRVILVEDHVSVREGLRRSLEAFGIEVVGEAGDGAAALQLVEKVLPDVAVVDVSLPDMDGISVTRKLTELHPEVQVVILTMRQDRSTLADAIHAGAAGYLVKDCTTAEIVDVINTVAEGQIDLLTEVAQGVLASERRAAEPILSTREVEVLQLVAEGATTAAVANRLFISTKTVKNHLSNIYRKLDSADRTQAVLQGLRIGIVRLR